MKWEPLDWECDCPPDPAGARQHDCTPDTRRYRAPAIFPPLPPGAAISVDACGYRLPKIDYAALPPRLSTDSVSRKAAPVITGVLDYFPDAIADVARLSKIGNDKHNPGEPLHWSRGRSDDHADCIGRHMLERGAVDTDGVLHDTKVAWRALAQLQLAIERLRAEGRYP